MHCSQCTVSCPVLEKFPDISRLFRAFFFFLMRERCVFQVLSGFHLGRKKQAGYIHLFAHLHLILPVQLHSVFVMLHAWSLWPNSLLASQFGNFEKLHRIHFTCCDEMFLHWSILAFKTKKAMYFQNLRIDLTLSLGFFVLDISIFCVLGWHATSCTRHLLLLFLESLSGSLKMPSC